MNFDRCGIYECEIDAEILSVELINEISSSFINFL
jgi:hypothetical protein